MKSFIALLMILSTHAAWATPIPSGFTRCSIYKSTYVCGPKEIVADVGTVCIESGESVYCALGRTSPLSTLRLSMQPCAPYKGTVLCGTMRELPVSMNLCSTDGETLYCAVQVR